MRSWQTWIGAATCTLGFLLSARGMAQEPVATGDTTSARAGGRPAHRQPRVIRDARLAGDSTVFPYEWPALAALQEELRALRPALEADSLAALARSVGRIDSAAARVIVDSLPPPLRPRVAEVRGRIFALRASLGEAAALAPAALVAPPPAVSEAEGVAEGGAAPDSAPGFARIAPGPAGRELVPPAAGEPPEAAPTPADTAGGDTTGGLESDPRQAFLDAWRDVFMHAEALVHAARKPGG